jgi:hypothetical protein
MMFFPAIQTSEERLDYSEKVSTSNVRRNKGLIESEILKFLLGLAPKVLEFKSSFQWQIMSTFLNAGVSFCEQP